MSAKSVILPWIAQSRGALAPSTELFVHNPGRAPLAVSLAVVPPSGDPLPCAGLTVAPNATAATADARRRLCGDATVAGVVVATVHDSADEPVAVSIDTLVVRGGGPLARTSPAMHEADAALPGQAQHLAGLRQGGGAKTALWLYNPSTDVGEYDLVYRALDGSEIGTARAGLGAASCASSALRSIRCRRQAPPAHSRLRSSSRAAPCSALASSATTALSPRSSRARPTEPA